MWKYTGKQRPSFAIAPADDQESVWDYPRPPALLEDSRHVRVMADEQIIAHSDHALRLLETAAPPTLYLPVGDIDMDALHVVPGQTSCEWKGIARYWALKGQNQPVAWDYPKPSPAFQRILHYLAFYPGRVDCFIDDEAVKPQSSEFYGGWITREIVGPFKGEPGTSGW